MNSDQFVEKIEEFIDTMMNGGGAQTQKEFATKMAHEKVESSIRVLTEEDDNWFAAVIRCRCNSDDCLYRKSGFIFETETEALDYADFMREQLKKELASDMEDDLNDE